MMYITRYQIKIVLCIEMTFLQAKGGHYSSTIFRDFLLFSVFRISPLTVQNNNILIIQTNWMKFQSVLLYLGHSIIN